MRRHSRERVDLLPTMQGPECSTQEAEGARETDSSGEGIRQGLEASPRRVHQGAPDMRAARMPEPDRGSPPHEATERRRRKAEVVESHGAVQLPPQETRSELQQGRRRAIQPEMITSGESALESWQKAGTATPPYPLFPIWPLLPPHSEIFSPSDRHAFLPL